MSSVFGRQSVRIVVLWMLVVIAASAVLLSVSEGEPVCEGPLILDVDDSDPPQCDDPVDGLLANAGPLAVAGLLVACLVETGFVVGRMIRRRRAHRRAPLPGSSGHEAVARAYDEVAELYASLFLHDLAADDDARPWLEAFVDLIDPHDGPVADLGCGPGHGVASLRREGVDAFGIEISAGQVGQARAAFPEIDVRVGDLTALDVDDATLGGIFSRYSIIHLPPGELDEVFAEWARVLAVGAPVLISFFASRQPGNHGRPFDHKVTTAHELDPARVAALLGEAGFVDVRWASVPPATDERPLDKGTVLGRRG